MNSNLERRRFLKLGVGAAGTLAMSGSITKAIAASCGLTPSQTSGPFYPGEKLFHPESDLTSIPGRSTRAQGQIISIRGKVLDQQCNPVRGANVEIWQACASGKYNHREDSNPAPLDPDFKYWAEAFTDANGEYYFKTIIPGAYPADATWTRPPHIHFKVTKLGYRELITQMYFKGNKLNDQDLILQQTHVSERENLIIDFQAAPVGFEPGSLIGNFDITIRSIR